MTELTVVTLIVICFTDVCVTGEAWQKDHLNLHIYFQNYSGHIDVSYAFKTSLNRCVSRCFLNSDSFFLYQQTTELCQCNSNKLDIDNKTASEDLDILYGLYQHGYQSYQLGSFEKFYVFPEERDCLSLYNRGFRNDGVYMIYPSAGNGVTAWCDMTGGGWTVIQRRQDGLEDFYKSWNEYVVGFGNRTGEYWLGLENMYKLTESPSSLYIEMETFGDVTPASAYASYSSFKIDGILTNYALHVDGFNGNCGDSFSYHNGAQFSTLDRDNDEHPGNCAATYSGAWWYRSCHSSNLNGLYLSGKHSSYANGMEWYSCWEHNYSVKASVMKIRRKFF